MKTLTQTITTFLLLGVFNILLHNVQQVYSIVAATDPDGEPMWGHVYISGGVVSYEFFRAKFGGKYNCELS